MSHGYYPEGEGPGTDDAIRHVDGCGCAECWYQREQLAQDYREEQELLESNPHSGRGIQPKEEPQ